MSAGISAYSICCFISCVTLSLSQCTQNCWQPSFLVHLKTFGTWCGSNGAETWMTAKSSSSDNLILTCAKLRSNPLGFWFLVPREALLVWLFWRLPAFDHLPLLPVVLLQIRAALVVVLVPEDMLSAFCSLAALPAKGKLEPLAVLPVRVWHQSIAVAHNSLVMMSQKSARLGRVLLVQLVPTPWWLFGFPAGFGLPLPLSPLWYLAGRLPSLGGLHLGLLRRTSPGAHGTCH